MPLQPRPQPDGHTRAWPPSLALLPTPRERKREEERRCVRDRGGKEIGVCDIGGMGEWAILIIIITIFYYR